MIFRRNKYGGLFVIDENAGKKAKANRKQRKERKLNKQLNSLEKEASNIFTSAKGNNKYAERGFRLDEQRADLVYESKQKKELSKPLTTDKHNKKVFNNMIKEIKSIDKQMRNNMSEQSRKALEHRKGQVAKKYASKMRSKGKG